MTGSSWGQADLHQKRGLCSWQHCSPTLSEGLQIELCALEGENATVKGEYQWQVVEIVIGGVPTILEICLIFLFMTLGRGLLQGSVMVDLFDPMRHQVDLQKVDVGILLLGRIYLVTDIDPPRSYFALRLGWGASFGISFLVYLSLVYEFGSQRIGIGRCLFAGWPH
jgi:hypothetical protein